MAIIKGSIEYGDYTINYTYGGRCGYLKGVQLNGLMIEKIMKINEFRFSDIINPCEIEQHTLDRIADKCHEDVEKRFPNISELD